jgi:predicted deacetylase
VTPARPKGPTVPDVPGVSDVPGTPKRLIISLHDVTPFHLERIRRAEALYRDLGLRKVAYLFVPEYHGGHRSAGNTAFSDFCGEKRPFDVQWQLHGYRHLEAPDPALDGPPDPGEPASRGGTGDALKRGLLTAGEGEFLALPPSAQRARLDRGLEDFRSCLGFDPEHFVAPAWLFNASLRPLLAARGIRFTEDQRRLHRTDRDARLDSPVITWATRTFLRKYGSLVVCPLLARLFYSAPYLRVAMHPFDFDHPVTVRNIRAVLERLIPGRQQAYPSELDFG